MKKNGSIPIEAVQEADMICVDRGSFDLIIPKNNSDDHGYFLVNSKLGHDCYSHNKESEHIYSILSGVGVFVVDGDIIPVKAGDSIKIQANSIFCYHGKMLMGMEMLPNFKQENDVFDFGISYLSQTQVDAFVKAVHNRVERLNNIIGSKFNNSNGLRAGNYDITQGSVVRDNIPADDFRERNFDEIDLKRLNGKLVRSLRKQYKK